MKWRQVVYIICEGTNRNRRPSNIKLFPYSKPTFNVANKTQMEIAKHNKKRGGAEAACWAHKVNHVIYLGYPKVGGSKPPPVKCSDNKNVVTIKTVPYSDQL